MDNNQNNLLNSLQPNMTNQSNMASSTPPQDTFNGQLPIGGAIGIIQSPSQPPLTPNLGALNPLQTPITIENNNPNSSQPNLNPVGSEQNPGGLTFSNDTQLNSIGITLNGQNITPDLNNAFSSTPPVSASQGIISLSSQSIIPEQKNTNVSNLAVDSTSEPNLSSANPFDIGIALTPISPMEQMSKTTLLTPQMPNTSVVNNPMNTETANPTISSTESTSSKENEPINDETIVSVGQYLGHLVLFSLPIIGQIMLIVKIFDKKNKNISNLAKAQLLLFAMMIILVVVFIVVFGTTFAKISAPKNNTLLNNNQYAYGLNR